MITRQQGEQLPADQVTTKNKEKIDPDPAETVHPPGQFESEKRSVINNDHNNRERSEQVESGLAFAISKTRIDFELMRVSDAARAVSHNHSSPISSKSFDFSFAARTRLTGIVES